MLLHLSTTWTSRTNRDYSGPILTLGTTLGKNLKEEKSKAVTQITAELLDEIFLI